MLYISNWNCAPGKSLPIAELERGLATVETAEAAARSAFEFANEWGNRAMRDAHWRAWQDLKDLCEKLAHDIAKLGASK
ncbi:Uncharacterised protein [Achromobacter xylosoxidans]|uniref:hypothetical protein n=1 Tax=Alcaligenes xylosoxydans xylosoxydans TaxID=85698 RepID=UPI0006C071FC|nr:hypothetical protein [Achromobacter xylosoxidans]CUI38494.1 Uncharacterised protein [Achromobacter xylosoxidans]